MSHSEHVKEHVWQKPILRIDEENNAHRAVTWLELFFDLVFVVVISRLAHNLLGEFSWHGVGEFIIMFFSVFWTWNATVYYVERFESQGTEIRIFTFLAMLPVAGMAIFSHHGLGSNYVGFACSYLAARLLNMFLWGRASIYIPDFRPVGIRFILGFSISLGIVISSFFAPEKYRVLMWTLAVILDIATPYFTMKQQAKLPKISTSKFPERFGLITIIMLGEAIVGVINGLSESHHFTADGIALGICGMLMVFLLWWLYFDFIARRFPSQKPTIALFWVYLHTAFLTFITIGGVSISGALAHLHKADEVVYVHGLGFSAAFSLISLGLLEMTLHKHEKEPTHPLVSPLIKIISGVVLSFIVLITSHGSVALPVILVVLLVNVGYGLSALFTRKKVVG